jgi:uncharacterized protein (DUF885 family)
MSMLKRLPFAFTVLLVVFLSRCGQPAATSTAPGNGDSAFNRLADEYLKGWMDWRPQSAVSLGLHQYDKQVTDYSKASIQAELQRLKEYSGKLATVDTASLSAQAFIDYRILRSEITSEIFGFEDMRQFTHNPMTYAGAVDVNTYVKRDFAPMEERIASIIAVEKQIPAMYENAKANLDDSMPRPYIETAIQITKGNSGFLKGDLLTALAGVRNDSLMASLKAANNNAAAATDGFVSWLQSKLPKSNQNYAIGSERYRRFLFNNEMTDFSPEKVLEIGLAELKREQRVFDSAAHIINPKKSAVEVYHEMEKEHPTADSLIADSRRHVEAIRQYVIDHNITTMPSEVREQVKETPLYARETSTASSDGPGPFETKATEAFYYITPVDPKWTAQQKEDWLASFNYYTTDVVTIHEAYPGHYTQFLHLNASKASKIEKIFGNYAFVEGWAHYTERMMLDEGFGRKGGDSVTAAKYRLAQSGDALLRICRLCVSIRTHCQGMSLDEATKFFMDNWYQGEKPSRQEALRGTFDPGYLFYTLGKLEILKLRDDYRQQEGSGYSLKVFNDAMLDNGMPPIRLMREILLKDKAKWGEVL